MNSSKILILVLLCVSALTWTNSCPGFHAGDLLQSGKNSFIKSGRNTEYTFDAPISFPIPSRGLELAVTAATIGDYDPSQSGFSFNVNGRRRGNSGFVQFNVIVNSQNSWSSIQVGWFASAREDFAVATIQYPVNTWVRGTGANVYDLVQVIPKQLPQGSYKVAAFISGFSTSATQFKISINQRSYDAWNRKVTITFFCGANPQPNTFTVAYIVYPEEHAQFEISYELAPKGQSGAYQISGPVSFGSNYIIQYNEFRIANRFLACSGNQCSNTCVLREECLELNGNAYEGSCVFCAPGILFEYGQCTRRCVGANQSYINRVCVCASGFVRKGKQCVLPGGGNDDKCKKDQILWNNQCRRCPNDASANPGQNTCNCRGGYLYDANANICYQPQPTCQFGQVWNGNRCVCQQNWGRYNGQCRQCPSGAKNNEQCVCSNGYTYDPQSNSCIFNAPACGPNKRWDGRNCVCNPGLVEINNQCVSCPQGSQPNYQANTCTCANNYRYDAQANACLPVNNCPDTFQWDGFRCRCPNNFIAWANRCRACPSNSKANRDQTTCVCDNNWQFDGQNNRCFNPCQQNEYPGANNECICVNGFYRYNNGPCKACPSGSRPNPAQTTCTCNRADQTFDLLNNKCVTKNNCGTNQVVGPTGQCVCVAGAIRYNGNCRLCPTNSKANQNSNTCVCQDGFTYDAQSNNCVSRCGLSQVWTPKGCQCISGYSWYGSACRQCPQKAQPTGDQRGCVCLSSTAIYISDSNICLECGANSQPNAQKTACQCLPGFKLNNNVCVSDIQCNFNQDLVNGNCQCKYGWVQLGPECVERCGVNQYYDGKDCLCKQGHVRSGGVCRPCPSGTVANGDKTACLCNDPRSVYVPSRFTCEVCPAFSAPNADDSDCVCFAGYRKQGNACVSVCPADATPDATGACVCSGGKFWANNQCNQPSVCPDRSTFNQQTFTCVCNTRGENIIGGVCKPCGQNSVWNKDQCVCSTGFFSIGGVCRTCDPRSKYDGTDCVCQLGYFGNRDLCTPCHKSCSKCTGAEANQCQSCSDVSLVLKDGYCTRNSPCNYGFYLEGAQCAKCTDNCIDCDNTFECRTCAIGYTEKKQTVAGQNVVSCDEICGDGIKYEQQCDDGNTKSGDGCSATCEEEPGWFCSGGSSNKPSVCRKFIPDRVQLSSKGAVNLGGQVILSVRASYLPACVTKNECAECFKVIKANVVNVNVPVLVTVSYVPFSQWQYYIKFDFQGLYVSSIFKVVIKLNEDYKGCIAAEDYDEQLELTVDPAFLAKVDQTDTLTLGAIQGEVPAGAKNYLGG